jgi:hypothetical protein
MGPRQDDLDDEIRGHMALSVKERIERGEDPEAARLAALKNSATSAHARLMRGVWRPRLARVGGPWTGYRFAMRAPAAKGLASTVVVTSRRHRRQRCRSFTSSAACCSARSSIATKIA